MKKVKKHIQNWKDIRIAVIPKLYEMQILVSNAGSFVSDE